MTGPLLPQVPKPANIEFEEWAARTVTAGLRKQLQAAARAITALYIRLAGSTDNPMPPALQRTFADGAAAILAGVHFADEGTLQQIVNQALAIGARDAAVSGVVAAATSTRPEVEDWVGTLVTTIVDRVLAQLTTAKTMSQIGTPPLTYKDIVAIVAHAYRALSLVERDTRWSVNAAMNQGILMSVNEAGVPRVWVAEWDACLHCLAYSGEVAQPYQPYLSGLTYYIDPTGHPKPVQGLLTVVWGPPLHPNCRCSQEPYLGSDGYPIMPWETSETSVSEALKREARRTVLNGRAGNDSLPARLRATSSLLARGANLPKSVEQRARAAVRAGAYR